MDETARWIIGIFLVGMFLYSCNPPPTGGPVEHKCWFETGYESC